MDQSTTVQSKWWSIGGSLLAGLFVSYPDRTNLSVALPQVAKDMGFAGDAFAVTSSWALTTFLIGYAFANYWRHSDAKAGSQACGHYIFLRFGLSRLLSWGSHHWLPFCRPRHGGRHLLAAAVALCARLVRAGGSDKSQLRYSVLWAVSGAGYWLHGADADLQRLWLARPVLHHHCPTNGLKSPANR